MRFIRAAALAALCVLLLQGQAVMRTRRKRPERKPSCSAAAICFTGEIFEGKEYRHAINSSLAFVLEPGWTIAVVPTHAEGDCQEFASVVNAPYRAHRQLDIDRTYGWTAEAEMDDSPREFHFVTNCADFRTESARLHIVLWGYGHSEQENNEALAKLGTSPLGEGRLWITKFRISHVHDTADDKAGKIEWMQFAVEIRLPK